MNITTTQMDAFKTKVKSFGYKGNPIFKGKMTKRYRNYAKRNLSAPTYLETYNANTNRWVKNTKFIDKRYKKKTVIKKKFQDKIKIKNNQAQFIITDILSETTIEKGGKVLENILNKLDIQGKYRIIITLDGMTATQDRTVNITKPYDKWFVTEADSFMLNSEFWWWDMNSRDYILSENVLNMTDEEIKNLKSKPATFLFTKIHPIVSIKVFKNNRF